jgi:hypothetical protein
MRFFTSPFGSSAFPSISSRFTVHLLGEPSGGHRVAGNALVAALSLA